MRNDASSARSTRQQLRPGTNNEDCAADDREAGPGDCCRNSDCFCNFLATFILRSGEKCKSSAFAGVKNVTDTSFRETVCRIDAGWGPGVLCQTFCPHSSTASQVIGLHTTVLRSKRSNRSVSCTAFFHGRHVLHPGAHARSRLRCGIRACQIQSVFCISIEFERDEPPSRARKGSECHPRNSSVLLSNSHDSQGWKRTCDLDRKVKAHRKVDAANS
jgi:hypothetical protein